LALWFSACSCCLLPQDLKKAIRDDPRYSKFSTSEKKCEKEFNAWLKDKVAKAREDYKQLLQVSLVFRLLCLFFHTNCDLGVVSQAELRIRSIEDMIRIRPR
jgi:hypothetical protein